MSRSTGATAPQQFQPAMLVVLDTLVDLSALFR
jgi:hypothetical protein